MAAAAAAARGPAAGGGPGSTAGAAAGAAAASAAGGAAGRVPGAAGLVPLRTPDYARVVCCSKAADSDSIPWRQCGPRDVMASNFTRQALLAWGEGAGGAGRGASASCA